MRAAPIRIIAVVLLASSVALAGCASPASPEVATTSSSEAGTDPTTAHVEMKDIKFSPDAITVAVGTTVTWTNHDAMGHTVTPADKAQWGSEGSGDDFEAWLQDGQTWSFTFSKPGTYTYYCIPHASKGSDGGYRGMTGTVIVGSGSGGAAGLTQAATPVPDRTVVPSPVAPARTAPDADGVVRITLETKEVDAQLADGTGYRFWTFDGTVPGPMLRVREGDTVEFTLKNAVDSTMSHSIDLHAVTGPGGGARATQTKPGEATSFRFKALDPGLYVYHCATPHIPTHVANGMYGLILVEPAAGLPPVDREFYVVQGEIYSQGELGEKGMQGYSLEKLLDERPEYFLMNGRVGALTGEGALNARVNDTVRIYFGVGAFVPSNFHVIGEVFDRVYPEGGTPFVENVQTTLVPAGGATIVEFKVEVPGTYILVDHALTHAIDRGAVGLLTVEGDENAGVFRGGSTPGSGH